MNRHRRYVTLWGVAVLLGIGWLQPVTAEFYKYTDKDGNTIYVDDKNRIPEEYREDAHPYGEKYDHLPADERWRRKEIDRRIEEQEASEARLWLDENLGVQYPSKDGKAPARQDRVESLQTKVNINNNRILVPVIVGYGGKKYAISLLLDTGASLMVLHREVAEQLKLPSIRSGVAQTAGGDFIRTNLSRLNYLKVGQITMSDPNVLIIDHEGPPVAYKGLLGMNFLRHFDYRIDYGNQVIKWTVRPQSSP